MSSIILDKGMFQNWKYMTFVLFGKQIAAGMVFLGSRRVSKHLTEIRLL